jgi:membrane protein insertase, YidC/Oxa1 family, N-terminal domain
LVVWATFFESPIIEQKKNENEITKNQDISSPSIDEKEIKSEVQRSEIINETKRIKVENENIKGSISLEGAIIDDVIFKNYKKTLDSDERVTFLNPKNSKKEYYIETGWATGGNEEIKLPLVNTVWEIKGNTNLTPGNPITLEWNNDEGLIFQKKIELDEKFLFQITQSIKNNSNKSFQFYPYAQITRRGGIEGRQIYILHEGFLGVFEDELKEENFKDIEKEKFTITSSKGWLGITDKYWLTAIVPEKGSEFKAEF